MRDKFVAVVKRFISEVQRDDLAGLSAELAYRFLFAVFPFGLFVAALASFMGPLLGLGDPTNAILGAVGDNLPPDVAAGVRPQLDAVLGSTKPGLLTIGAIAALWAATGGTNALIKAMNRAYEVPETRPLIPRYALAIGLTLLASVGILAAFVTIVGASFLTNEVVRQAGLDPTVVEIISLLRWPVVFLFLAVAVGILYKLAPNFDVPFKWCVAGGALFAVGWLAATALFGLYVMNFGHYSNTYGALGGVIVLMLWFYLSAFVLVGAAAFVAAGLKELRPELMAEKRAAKETAAGNPVVRRARQVTGAAIDGAASSIGSATDPARGSAPGDLERARTDDKPPAPTPPARVLSPAEVMAAETSGTAGAPASARVTGGASGSSRWRDARPGARPARSTPGDWAAAATVAMVGATVGALAARLLGDGRR
jgi:membrane protein